MDETKTNVHEDHRERMRERFSKNGFDNYRPHEVLEQLLFECRPRVNTNPLGHELENRFGSIMNVLDAPPEEIGKVDGIGVKSAEFLSTVKSRLSELICEQYRTMGKVTAEMTAFLVDWFMKRETGNLGVILCDDDGVFREWKEIRYMYGGENGFDYLSVGDCLFDLVEHGKFIIVFNDTDIVPKSTVYRLLDYCSAKGIVMSDAYIMKGHKPVSLLFREPVRGGYLSTLEKR